MTEAATSPHARPEVLTWPAPDARATSVMGHYLDWLKITRGHEFDDYRALWHWSVTDLAGFWASIWDYCGVRAHTPYQTVLASPDMPGARWFPGATLNYAEHALGEPADTDAPAVLAHSQTRPPVTLTFGDLRAQVRRARAGLRRLGVGPGDRVVAYLPNIPETLVAYLATASLGAIWASCSPEFGVTGTLDRFGQIEPTVLLAVGGYRYGRKDVDRRAQVEAVAAGLPTLRHVVGVRYGDFPAPAGLAWEDLLASDTPLEQIDELSFTPVPFDHPLCVLFTSGTTGRPKAIVHGHGGILLEHLKNHALHWDLAAGDRLFWYTTTAWMMWNALVSALLRRSSIVMIDADVQYPDLGYQWRLAEQTRPTVLGLSCGFIVACRRAGLAPGKGLDLSSVRQVGAVGSPLPPEGYYWVHQQFGDRVLLNVGSGGTDVCTGLVQGSPLQPVWVGEISGPSLGVDARAFDERGRTVAGQLGELVVTRPMPSMPIGFWGDPDGSQYRETYFSTFPGVWRHGDWVRFTEVGSCVVAGRSDATLNRGGVRMGTAEFYRVVEELEPVVDSLVVHLEDPSGGLGQLVLFVACRAGTALSDRLRQKLVDALRSRLSPRHVPDRIVQVPAIPRTRTGKKLEVPVKRLLRGEPPESVVNRDALADPAAIDAFLAMRDAFAGSSVPAAADPREDG